MKRWMLLVFAVAVFGCGKQADQTKLPVFSLATSEYPSWSTYMVAGKTGLINAQEGAPYGTMEAKWGVDVVLKVADYEPCMTYYGNGVVDAVAITNMDAMNPAISRPSTAIMPTSSSIGGDAVLSTVAKTPADLKKVKVYGLSKSVSEYTFVRGLEKSGLDPKEFTYAHLDPGPASTALQTGASEVKAICVWNPFQLTVLRKNPEAKVVFSSELIPFEIIDMIVVGNDSLKKPKGEDFARCLCEVQYKVNEALTSADRATADRALQALGEDFCKLSVDDMRIVCKQTRFFNTAKDGIAFFGGAEFPKIMEQVIKTCKQIGVLEKDPPTIGYNDPSKQLNFSTKFMQGK